jgi:hypothetical protein
MENRMAMTIGPNSQLGEAKECETLVEDKYRPDSSANAFPEVSES